MQKKSHTNSLPPQNRLKIRAGYRCSVSTGDLKPGFLVGLFFVSFMIFWTVLYWIVLYMHRQKRIKINSESLNKKFWCSRWLNRKKVEGSAQFEWRGVSLNFQSSSFSNFVHLNPVQENKLLLETQESSSNADVLCFRKIYYLSVNDLFVYIFLG